MRKGPNIELDNFRSGDYCGYDIRFSTEPDDELTRVGPGTPCGEYLRRYWQPVFLTEELKDLPIAVRILGEDLVIFRDQSGQIGLVHKRCPHRRASLEFGTCDAKGIRCCYHGWLFDVDGSLLEAPGQGIQLEERLKARIRLGAYPVIEFKGLIFAYMGPAHQLPEFPIYDSLELPDIEMVPYKAPFQCNWLQVLDAIVDPIHTSFLHSNVSRKQFSEGFGEVGQIDFFEKDAWILGCNTRRVGDNVWFRINELVLPNYTQAGSAFAVDGTKSHYYGRSSFSRWVVPVDDVTTICYAWANYGDRGDPQEYNTPEGPELIEQGEVFDRTYDQKQRFPADVEAVEGMGPITVHENENLVISDKGIALMRRRIREQVRKVTENEKPIHVTDFGPNPVPTYGGDSVINVTAREQDESKFFSQLAHKFVEAQYEVDGKPESERINHVTRSLVAMEAANKGSGE